MFKRITALACVLGLLCMLCACAPQGSQTAVDPEEMEISLPLAAPNYNNVNSSYTTFCVSNGIAFYEDYTSFNPGIAMASGDQKALLIPSEEFGEEPYIDSILAVGDRVYAAGMDGYDGTTLFYAYDLSTNRYEHVLTVQEQLLKWLVTEDYLAYSLYYGEEDGAYPLYIYSFDKGEKRLVSEEIEDFGIVNGALRYVAYDGSYHLYEYDRTNSNSKELCSFEGYSIKIGVNYYFTEDRVVLFPWEDYSMDEQTKWKVCHVADGTEQEYTMPATAHTFIVGEQVAYAVTYQTGGEDGYSLKDAMAACPIYRIELATGAYEALPITETEANEIYVASDDLLYLFNYSVSSFLSSRLIVTPYTVSTGEKGETWVL